MKLRETCRTPETAIRFLFALATLACFLMALICPDRATMFAGLSRICTQSSQLTKSYFDAAYGGFAGAFLNVALVNLVCLLIYFLPGAKPDGVSVLAYFLTMGMSFWGINALNMWFCFAGVALYCLVKKQPLGSQANAMLFATGLAPIVSEMLFFYPIGTWHEASFVSVILALVVGGFVGFILPAGLKGSPAMHKGYTLYSAAVPIGLTAFFLRALLFKVFAGTLADSVGVGTGDSFWAISNIFCFAFFGVLIIWGAVSGGAKQYGALLKDSGFGVDFAAKYGVPTAIFNLGIYGLFIMLYYNLIGANWNAITLGCVFCVICCGFKGSHPGNVWPIWVGYVLASFAAKGICTLTGGDFALAINVQAIVVGACFANGLSPIAGRYGWPIGILAGMVHYTFVTCVPLLHGGFCLYNGGFTAAFVCFLLIPVLEHFFQTKEERKQMKTPS